MPQDAAIYRWENIPRTVTIAAAEVVIVTLSYGCIAGLGKYVYGKPEKGN
jgi:hypothetical protein